MPSPVGHLLGATAVYVAGTKCAHRSSMRLMIALAASLVPDLDFLPGFLVGDIGAFHHGISHSFSFALVFGAVVFGLARWMRDPSAGRTGALAAAIYGSHLVLDCIGVSPGTKGVPLLWPIVDHSFGVPLGLFGHFRHGSFSDGIWSVVRWENVGPLLRELIILGAVVVGLLWHEQFSHPWRSLQARRMKRRA